MGSVCVTGFDASPVLVMGGGGASAKCPPEALFLLDIYISETALGGSFTSQRAAGFIIASLLKITALGWGGGVVVQRPVCSSPCFGLNMFWLQLSQAGILRGAYVTLGPWTYGPAARSCPGVGFGWILMCQRSAASSWPLPCLQT